MSQRRRAEREEDVNPDRACAGAVRPPQGVSHITATPRHTGSVLARGPGIGLQENPDPLLSCRCKWAETRQGSAAGLNANLGSLRFVTVAGAFPPLLPLPPHWRGIISSARHRGNTGTSTFLANNFPLAAPPLVRADHTAHHLSDHL